MGSPLVVATFFVFLGHVFWRGALRTLVVCFSEFSDCFFFLSLVRQTVLIEPVSFQPVLLEWSQLPPGVFTDWIPGSLLRTDFSLVPFFRFPSPWNFFLSWLFCAQLGPSLFVLFCLLLTRHPVLFFFYCSCPFFFRFFARPVYVLNNLRSPLFEMMLFLPFPYVFNHLSPRTRNFSFYFFCTSWCCFFSLCHFLL